jgi:uncharacterized protein (TIGR02145 family)
LHLFTRWTGGAVAAADFDTAVVTVSAAMTVTADFRKREAPPPVYGALIDGRDGKTYKTVKIGKHTWMAENLNYETDSSWCYDNADSNCVKYGRLYVHSSAMAACPSGWHLSTKPEWENLLRAVDGVKKDYSRQNAGKKLRTRSGWNRVSKFWNDEDEKNRNGTDEYGFSALPGGYRWMWDGHFSDAGYDGSWWIPNGGAVSIDNHRNYCVISDVVGEGFSYRDGNNGLGAGRSVRCVMDGK